MATKRTVAVVTGSDVHLLEFSGKRQSVSGDAARYTTVAVTGRTDQAMAGIRVAGRAPRSRAGATSGFGEERPVPIEHHPHSGRRSGDAVALVAPVPKRVNRTQQVLAALREAITDGRLAPGSLHSAQSLANDLQVSRTPAREALLQLARDGYVRFEPNRGVRILQSSSHDIAEIFELRLWLEVPAVRHAAVRRTAEQLASIRSAIAKMERAAGQGNDHDFRQADRAFHKAILEASGNYRLAEYVDQLRHLSLLRELTTVRQGRSMALVIDAHRPILKAIEDRDAVAAGDAIAAHLNETAEMLLKAGPAMGQGTDGDMTSGGPG